MARLIDITPETIKFQDGYSFTRATPAWQTNENGIIEKVSAGALRNAHYIDGVRHWLTEPASTNVLHNSFSPATQSRTLGAGTWTLSIKGSGSVNANGATDGDYGDATEGTGNHLTFTVTTSQSVTFTVSGTVTHFQAENRGKPTTFIETAAGSATRNADELSVGYTHTPQAATVYADIVDLGVNLVTNGTVVHIGANSSPQVFLRNQGAGLDWRHANGAGQDRTARLQPTTSFGDRIEANCTLDSDGIPGGSDSVNGGTPEDAVVTGSGTVPLQSAWSNERLDIGRSGAAASPVASVAYRRILIVTGVQSLDEMRKEFPTDSTLRIEVPNP